MKHVYNVKEVASSDIDTMMENSVEIKQFSIGS